MKFKRPTPIFGKQKKIPLTKLDGDLPITESWNKFKSAIPISVSPEIFALMKQSYFSGALSLYGAVMLGLDGDTQEATPDDLSKMVERIHNELFRFKDNQKPFLLDAMREWEIRKNAQ